MRIDWFLFHVASGHAFFSGLGLIALGILAAAVLKERRRRFSLVLVLTGLVLVAISATPLPWIVYGVLVIALSAWVVLERKRESLSLHVLSAARAAVGAAGAMAALIELPFHVAPEAPRHDRPVLAVIGDSVTAGIGENEANTWPSLLASRHGIEVHDYSAMGATVATAVKQAARLEPTHTIVVVEIGGNDLLGSTSAADFAVGLDKLLETVRSEERTVLMFELPLPPGLNRYGSIQRASARKHGVGLIPKRSLMGVLTSRGATLDTIHLSQLGHDLMADVVWDVICGAWSDRPANPCRG